MNDVSNVKGPVLFKGVMSGRDRKFAYQVRDLLKEREIPFELRLHARNAVRPGKKVYTQAELLAKMKACPLKSVSPG